RRAVAGHRAGRGLVVRGAARPGRPGSARQGRCGRPGNDVRLRDERDEGADAPSDHARAQDLQAARRGAQGGRAPVSAAARHGGGAFSGKDPTKVDRSAAYAARYVAKNLVAAGLADRCEVNVAYAIGVAHPVSIALQTFNTEHIPAARIAELVRKHFDLRPAAILRDLDLRRPIFAKTAAYGHFGREDRDFTWERTDKAAALRSAAGLNGDAPYATASTAAEA